MSEAARQRLLDAAEVYALHAVSGAEEAEIERDLGSVDDTARVQFTILVSEIQETLALVSVLDATPPPAELKARVLERIPAIEQVAPSPPAPSNVSSMRRHRDKKNTRWRTVMMAAAAAVVVAVGGAVVATQVIGDDPSRAEQIVAAPDTRQASIAFPEGGTATISYSRSSDSVVVTLDGVPDPAPGQDYQMWLVEDAPRSVGLVSPELLTGDSETIIDGLGASTGFAFSREPAGGSPAPTDVIEIAPLDV